MFAASYHKRVVKLSYTDGLEVLVLNCPIRTMRRGRINRSAIIPNRKTNY